MSYQLRELFNKEQARAEAAERKLAIAVAHLRSIERLYAPDASVTLTLVRRILREIEEEK